MKMQRINITVIGGRGVGTSSMIHRLCYQNMPSMHQPPNWHMYYQFEGLCQIRDTMCSLEDFFDRRDRRQALTDSHAVILVYRADQVKTFHMLSMYVDEIKLLVEGGQITMPNIVVVANKIDLCPEGSHAITKGMEWAATMGWKFFCVSSKLNRGIGRVFDHVYYNVRESMPAVTTVSDNHQVHQSQSCCSVM